MPQSCQTGAAIHVDPAECSGDSPTNGLHHFSARCILQHFQPVLLQEFDGSTLNVQQECREHALCTADPHVWGSETSPTPKVAVARVER